jgi:hypothetical protein
LDTSDKASVELYRQRWQDTFDSSPGGKKVRVPKLEELASIRLFMSEGGGAGFA